MSNVRDCAITTPLPPTAVIACTAGADDNDGRPRRGGQAAISHVALRARDMTFSFETIRAASIVAVIAALSTFVPRAANAQSMTIGPLTTSTAVPSNDSARSVVAPAVTDNERPPEEAPRRPVIGRYAVIAAPTSYAPVVSGHNPQPNQGPRLLYFVGGALVLVSVAPIWWVGNGGHISTFSTGEVIGYGVLGASLGVATVLMGYAWRRRSDRTYSTVTGTHPRSRAFALALPTPGGAVAQLGMTF